MEVGAVGSVGQAKGASFEVNSKKASETVIDRENDKKTEPGSDNQEFENIKGVQEVDAKV